MAPFCLHDSSPTVIGTRYIQGTNDDHKQAAKRTLIGKGERVRVPSKRIYNTIEHIQYKYNVRENVEGSLEVQARFYLDLHILMKDFMHTKVRKD